MDQTQTPELLFHKPVLVDEVLHHLNPQPGKTYLDVTFGSGGHTRAILEKEPKCKVIAMDWDQRTLDTYGPILEQEFGDRLRLIWGNFALLYKNLRKEDIGKVDGILADFGTSQMQIEERPGFSVFRDTPLDMRMAPAYQKVTADYVINKGSERMLREIFWQLGEENKAKWIVEAIIQERKKNKIRTTKQLAKIIQKVVPSSKKKRIHPATKVFQALRIYINKELNNISAFLPMAINLLNPGGRLVCISFHSLEDRIVKKFFNEKEAEGVLEILTKKVVKPTDEEKYINPSSRSSKLRAAQKI